MKLFSNKKIINCDFSEKNQEMFFTELKKFNPEIKVSRVHSCEELLYMLSKNKTIPFIIFLNSEMPKKDSIKCLEEIKSNDYFRELKVIMIGLNKKDVIRDSYENGANLYVIQPSVKSDYQNIFKKVFSLKWNKYLPQPSKDKFVLTPSRYRG